MIATAGDPALESWLAFMGNCHALSLAKPGVPIVNIDVGGGTTNLALGIDGQVVAAGALHVGAAPSAIPSRHAPAGRRFVARGRTARRAGH